MAQTKLMRADEITAAFNGATERKYWKASIAGTRVRPEVNFNSRASMVCVTYRIASNDFTITFSKTSAAFGDFIASAYRSLGQVLAGMKAGGIEIASVIAEDVATLRFEYDPRAKVCTFHIAHHGDAWLDAEPLPFKAPVRPEEKIFAENEKSVLAAIDL